MIQCCHGLEICYDPYEDDGARLMDAVGKGRGRYIDSQKRYQRRLLAPTLVTIMIYSHG